jgi:cytochrome c-type biogenesis protein CcmE
MPKEVADALKKQGHWKDDYGEKSQAGRADQGTANSAGTPNPAGAAQRTSQ